MGLGGRENTMIGVSAAYIAVAWIAFSLRTIVKGRIMRSFGLDDWLMVVTMVCAATPIESKNHCTHDLTAYIHSRQ